ncbi:MAG: DNA mismatch repair endonuclease MutL [Treponema sp.]|nr:DNA mismatch repair endonuclease MutL [Treponema sp.]
MEAKVRQLSADVARKIAAGEVIDRPNAIVRELLDNAVDSGATKISVEITGGGIEKIRVKDNGCGMSKEDLAACARPHATSKISSETDLLNLSTLGFRGEALASMAAVSRLEITSGTYRMSASVTEDHVITSVPPVTGTIVQTQALFENFPARRVFLKRSASEAALCRSTFEEKAIARPDIAFTFTSDGDEKLNLPAGQSLTQRFCQTLELFESEDLFYEIKNSSAAKDFSFSLVIGEPSVSRSNRKNIYIYVNGRRINEYSLIQAIEYGAQGYFPNGTHPVASLFVTMNPALVDFNIHPAKREARFKDISQLHHEVSSATKNFFRQYTLKNIINQSQEEEDKGLELNYGQAETMYGGASSVASPDEPTDLAKANAETNASSSDFIVNTKMPGFSKGYGHGGYSQSYSQSMNHTSFGRGNFTGRSQYEKALTEEMEASINGHFAKPNYLPDPELSTSGENKGSSDFHFVGMALGTFLIAEKNDVLYIIDQHAAHERILYNRIMEDAGQKQTLLVPYIVQTDNAADDNYINALKEKLEQAGFTGKDCGNGKWEFSTVPIRWKGTEADLKKDLLDRRINPHDMINAAAASTACRTAVMDGDVLDSKTAAEIAEKALELPDPHCPHGRPVYTTITRKQLFALVKRI